jgi:hypothetical protein
VSELRTILKERVFVDDRPARAGFACPYCQALITPSMRMSYPRTAIGQYATVYRCRCGRHIGEPVRSPIVARD